MRRGEPGKRGVGADGALGVVAPRHRVGDHDNVGNIAAAVPAEDVVAAGKAGKDDETVELCRGLRFLIDDTDSEFVTAYQITKSNKLFNSYNGHGVFRFILNEVQLQQGDNKELRIADYTIWKPGETLDSDHVDSTATVAEIVAAAEAEAAIPKDDNKKGWL